MKSEHKTRNAQYMRKILTK